ncbi:acyltransferase [Vibrio sp. TH_r3]|uniref:acyltransferase family protein n=1 Tax=Vibrio sp. TH_r3 TaxID=3082084 RepID=UPI0029532007|nr:acyltransferase [Vibrio sp. TH_r3]MDV7102877.1 acyltransferase [Vibrio sp. TH_r3]
MRLWGVAILWVMLFHSKIVISESIFYIPIKILKSSGYIGVDIFILLSGMGVYHSINDGFCFKKYISRRLLKIIPAFWFSLTIFYILKSYDGFQYEASEIIYSFLGLDLFINDSIVYWFIPSIFICYLIAPILVKVLDSCYSDRYKLTSLLILYILGLIIVYNFLSVILIFYIRVPVFFLGLYVGKCIVRTSVTPQNLVRNSTIITIVGMLVVALILGMFDWQYRKETGISWYISAVLAFPITIVICEFFERNKVNTRLLNVFFRKLGVLSLELYLFHIIIFEFLVNVEFWRGDWNFLRIPEYILYVIFSFLLSVLFVRFLKTFQVINILNRSR